MILWCRPFESLKTLAERSALMYDAKSIILHYVLETPSVKGFYWTHIVFFLTRAPKG
jgi:hypothetical protein